MWNIELNKSYCTCQIDLLPSTLFILTMIETNDVKNTLQSNSNEQTKLKRLYIIKNILF